MTLSDTQWDVMFCGWVLAVVLLAELWFDYRRRFPRPCRCQFCRYDDLMLIADATRELGPPQERIP